LDEHLPEKILKRSVSNYPEYQKNDLDI
jgi:hypothetical protein